MNTNIEILKNFRDYLLSCKGYSVNTVNEYCLDLKDFFEFIIWRLDLGIEIKDINIFILGGIDQKNILEYISFLAVKKKNKPPTRQRHIASIKSFYNWLYLKYSNVLKNKDNPSTHLPRIEKQLRLPKYLNLETAKKLQNVFNSSNCKTPERNNLIIKIFLNCGLRLAELQGINLEDINFDDKTILIKGKGNKYRKAYLNTKIAKELQNYIGTRENEEEALFLSSRKKRISRESIQSICKKAFDLLELDKKYSVHSLRHTAATIMYESTNDILLVKEFLGHESIEATQIYTHISDQQLKDAINRHPLNNII